MNKLMLNNPDEWTYNAEGAIEKTLISRIIRNQGCSLKRGMNEFCIVSRSRLYAIDVYVLSHPDGQWYGLIEIMLTKYIGYLRKRADNKFIMLLSSRPPHSSRTSRTSRLMSLLIDTGNPIFGPFDQATHMKAALVVLCAGLHIKFVGNLSVDNIPIPDIKIKACIEGYKNSHL